MGGASDAAIVEDLLRSQSAISIPSSPYSGPAITSPSVGSMTAAPEGGPGPEALLEERLKPAPGQRLDQTMLYRKGGYVPDAALMRRHPGIGVVARVDPRAMPVIVGCDGSRPLGEVINRVTQGLGDQRVEVATLCFATVRAAFELGLLEPSRQRTEARLPRRARQSPVPP